MARQRLSQRMAGAQPDGPFEGVPDHLSFPLLEWVRARIGLSDIFLNSVDANVLREVAVRFRAALPYNAEYVDFALNLTTNARLNEDVMLDLVDTLLDVIGPENNCWEQLDRMLSSGASVWRVGQDHTSLARVVTDEAQATFNTATTVADESTNELKEAWANAFGRNGDPSDAWDHAIKAMEALFIPLVIPNKAKPNLGGVIGELRNQGHVWKIVLPGKDQNHDVAPLVGMLDGIWPNVDRHAGSATSRPPTPEEARAVVTLAATIVQWHRGGSVLQRR